MVETSIHRITKMEDGYEEKIRKLEKTNLYVRRLVVEKENGETYELSLFSENKENLKYPK